MDHAEPVDVVAIIVTYQRADALDECVAALRRQTRPVRSLIVDNGPDDAVMIRYHAASDIKVIRTGENAGAAGGFHAGLRQAGELGIPWVLMLNDDDVLVDHTVETLWGHATRDPSDAVAAVIGSVMVDSTTRTTGARFDRGIRLPRSHESVAAERDVDVSTFTGLLVNTEIALAVGGIRADYFMMWEEYDFCLRLRAAGYRVVALSEPLVVLAALHGTSAPYPPWRAYYEARNGILTLRSHTGHGAWRWFALREAKYLLAGLTLPLAARRTTLRLRGLMDGLRSRTGRLVEP